MTKQQKCPICLDDLEHMPSGFKCGWCGHVEVEEEASNAILFIGAICLLILFVASWWLATGDVDNVEAMGQADYERMQCIDSQLPGCRAQQVAGK